MLAIVAMAGTRLERLPAGVEKSRLSNPKAKSVDGKSRLCSASDSTLKSGIDPAGAGAGCAPTLDDVFAVAVDARRDWQLHHVRARMHRSPAPFIANEPVPAATASHVDVRIPKLVCMAVCMRSLVGSYWSVIYCSM